MLYFIYLFSDFEVLSINTRKPQRRRRMLVNSTEEDLQPGSLTNHLLAEVKLLSWQIPSGSQEKKNND